MGRVIFFFEEEKIKRFVRGEISFQSLTNHIEDISGIEFACKGKGYKVTLQDIREALTHFAEKGAGYPEVIEDWYDNLYWYLGDMISLPELIGVKGTCMELLELNSAWGRFFFKDETELANWVVSRLDDMDDEQWSHEDDQEYCAKTLKNILEVMDNYEVNKDREKKDWIFTHAQKEEFIEANGDDRTLAMADSVTKDFYKEFLLELAGEGNINAIKDLGYAYYGDDNPVFPCDWEKSRDCMLVLMEKAPDEWKAMAANTLGYIYYYGRCNDGVPQYDEAYRYFSMAAFFGYYEAIYKVGDMLRDGKGIFKNEEAAFRMYQWVYNDNYQKFIGGGDSVLSDAALRLGSCYQHGTGTYKDLKTAYYYYLIARLAIDERMKKSNFFGLNKVSASIRTGIAEVRAELGDEVQKKSVNIYMPNFLDSMIFDKKKVKEVLVKVSEKKNGYNITLKRISPFCYMNADELFCYTDISYCKKTNEITFFVPKDVPIDKRSDKKTFKADKFKVKKGEIHFYYKKKLVFSVSSDFWQLKAEKQTGADKMHRFVSIAFEKEGRTYDYLCDGMVVKAGDMVLVPSFGGPKEVEVLRVFEQSEADAPLDITRYKSVIME